MLKKRYILLFSVFLTIVALFAIFPDVVSAANPFDLDTGKVNLDVEDQKTVTKIKNSFSTAMGDKFAGDLSNLFLSFQHIARIIVVIMTAMAGMMIAFGLGGASQLFFKWIFGVGVALNIADFGWSLFGDDYWVDTQDSNKTSDEANKKTAENLDKVTKLHHANDNDAAWYDIFSNFMNYYKDAFIDPAYARLMPIAVKMTMVLWFIDTSMKVALGLTQQDLINFFTKQILKLGIYIFLITNWWSPIGSSQAKELSEKAGSNMQIMAVLGDGFENLGYYAAGGKEDKLKNSDGEVVTMQSNSIFKNTMALWSVLWGSITANDEEIEQAKAEKEKAEKEKAEKEKAEKEKGPVEKIWDSTGGAIIKKGEEWIDAAGKAIGNTGRKIVGAAIVFRTGLMGPVLALDLFLLLSIIGILLYIALEVFMVRVEFYTMAVLTVMLLPFAMIDQLKFLADKAISLMFNLAIKCFVMAFMSVAIVNILSTFIKKIRAEEGAWTNWFLDVTLMLQLALLVAFLGLLTKKIPQLCNGLLSGNPSLSGGDVMGQVTKAVGIGAAAVVTGGAGAAAGAAGATGGMASKLMGGIKGGMGAMGRGAMNYALTQNPLGQSFAQGMNLFSGNGTSPGLAQKGGLSQALGLTTTDIKGDKTGVVDKMAAFSGDKSKDGEKPKNEGNSTSNNNNQNQTQNTPAATGKDGGKETIEKQIGEVNKQLDRIEKILNGGGGNGGTNPSGNNPPNNSGNSGNPANNTQYTKVPDFTAGTQPTLSTQTFNTAGNQNPQTNQTVVTNTKTDTLKNSNSEKNNPKK